MEGAKFYTSVQTGPGAHPASFAMGTGSFPEVKRPGRGVDHPPHLAPRLEEELSYTSTHPVGLHGLSEGDLYLYFMRKRKIQMKQIVPVSELPVMVCCYVDLALVNI